MRNFIQPGDIITQAAPYQRNSGQAALLGTLVGVACDTVANGAIGDFKTTGVFTLDKATGQAWTTGAVLYWDDTARNFTTTVGATTRRAGTAYAAAGSGDTTGRVRLTGVPSIANVA